MVSTVLVVAVVFLSSVDGMARGFRSVTDEYGWRLRKRLVLLGLVSLVLLLGPGVVDTFRACFFFFLLLCAIQGFVSAIDLAGFGAYWLWFGRLWR